MDTNVRSNLIYPLVMDSRRCVKFVVCKIRCDNERVCEYSRRLRRVAD